ncbi:hypothetical protein NSPZN2_30060 [Nitrospira defluvii]|uniref:Uncharacterized protein n=1 Tax=Nitrospira defluvii TaxID=330214 RepID=A0ABN7LHR5_9BACT|nr:hypothetical protein NSPZN2_30060 [Nitrospira defluvii]
MRSVPPYNFGGTLSQSGDTWAILIRAISFIRERSVTSVHCLNRVQLRVDCRTIGILSVLPMRFN